MLVTLSGITKLLNEEQPQKYTSPNASYTIRNNKVTQRRTVKKCSIPNASNTVRNNKTTQ